MFFKRCLQRTIPCVLGKKVMHTWWEEGRKAGREGGREGEGRKEGSQEGREGG